jgi:hypothetical protein
MMWILLIIIVGIVLIILMSIGEETNGVEFGNTYDFYDDSNNSPYSKHPRHSTDIEGNEK